MDLIITMAICSILHGGCKAETLYVTPPENALPYEIMMGPQLAMAKWKAQNEEWTIVRWALSRPSRFARS